MHGTGWVLYAHCTVAYAHCTRVLMAQQCAPIGAMYWGCIAIQGPGLQMLGCTTAETFVREYIPGTRRSHTRYFKEGETARTLRVNAGVKAAPRWQQDRVSHGLRLQEPTWPPGRRPRASVYRRRP